MERQAALVLFSGGQDSATCLAWALDRFDHVETVGYAYGQRHAVELACREPLLDGLKALDAGWAGKLGEHHTLDIPTLAAVSETAMRTSRRRHTRRRAGAARSKSRERSE